MVPCRIIIIIDVFWTQDIVFYVEITVLEWFYSQILDHKAVFFKFRRIKTFSADIRISRIYVEIENSTYSRLNVNNYG